VTVGGATANLLLTDDNTKILQNPRIRATDGQKATMKIGSKIPIATGSYQTGAATAVVSSLVNTQFQYTDVGVNIEMTPTVHFDHDVTLKIKIEVSAQSGQVTISGVTEPIFSQRVVDQVIRLREGEASILGGLQDKQEANQLERHSRAEFDSHPQIPLRFQGSHHLQTTNWSFSLCPTSFVRKCWIC
jgi:general secretion pathway protein D